MHFDSRLIDGATRITCCHEESGEVGLKRRWPLRSRPLNISPNKRISSSHIGDIRLSYKFA